MPSVAVKMTGALGARKIEGGWSHMSRGRKEQERMDV